MKTISIYDDLLSVTSVAQEWANRTFSHRAEEAKLNTTKREILNWLQASQEYKVGDIIIPNALLSIKSRKSQLSERKLKEFAETHGISLEPFAELFNQLQQPSTPYLELRQCATTDGIVKPFWGAR